MARPQLTKEAIAFIIECRDDPTRIYTWKDIAKLVDDKFGISVSLQAIANNYRKYKGSQDIAKIATSEKTEIANKPVFKPKTQIPNQLQGFNKEAINIDLDDLLKPAE